MDHWGGLASAVALAIPSAEDDLNDDLLKQLAALNTLADVVQFQQHVCTFSFYDRNRANSPLLDQLLDVCTLTKTTDQTTKKLSHLDANWTDLLEMAAYRGHLEATNFFLHRSAAIGDALHCAVSAGHFDIIKLLLNHGAPMPSDAIWTTANHGHFELLKLLLNHGADVHSDGDTALLYASGHGHLEMVKHLIAHGANVHAKNGRALLAASRNNHIDVVKLLVDHGADMHADRDIALSNFCRHGNIAAVNFLLEHGADVHCRYDQPLQYASYYRHTELFQLLLEHGADRQWLE